MIDDNMKFVYGHEKLKKKKRLKKKLKDVEKIK